MYESNLLRLRIDGIVRILSGDGRNWMTIKLILRSFLLLVLIALMTACHDDSDIDGEDELTEEDDKLELVMGTGMEGGTYLPVGDELVNIWNRHLEHIHVKAIESNASVENLEKIANDEFDLALTVNLPAYDALAGIGDFDENPVENVAFISHVKPEPLQIITREKTRIKNLED